MKKIVYISPFNTLKKAFFILILPIVSIITVTLFISIQWNILKDNNDYLYNKLQHQLEINSLIMAYPMWNVNEERVSSIIELIIEDSDITGISIFDENDILFSSRGNINRFTRAELNTWIETNTSEEINLLNLFNHITMALGMKNNMISYHSGSQPIFFKTDDNLNFTGTLYIILSNENINIQLHKQILIVLSISFLILIVISISILITYQMTIGSPILNLKKSIQTAGEEQGMSLGDKNIRQLNELEYINEIFNKLWENQKFLEKEKTSLQELLNHRNKMDSLGQLAGGMAHDFNNVLNGIMSASQLLKLPARRLDETSLKYVDLILKASIRAAGLIEKLLSFSRKGKKTSSVINLDEILKDTVNILERTIDKKITLTLNQNAHKTNVKGDLSELENILINLGINASQALNNGGMILISTENVDLDQIYCDSSAFDILPGSYCKIGVSDNGSGISPENLNRIFEPFFTTKAQGKGTGLGLSAVYGAIQDYHGEILVISDVGVGTTFYILLPCTEKPVEKLKNERKRYIGPGTVLFVDDEEINRTIGKDVLESLGYNVILAENGQESIEIFEKNFSEIDIVILDMIMPVMTGSEAFLKMKEIDKNCKAIISSGFTKNENIEELKASGLIDIIRKPYDISELGRLLDDIMHKKA